MTVEELISQLSKYDRNLPIVIVNEYGKPFHVSYCSRSSINNSEEKLLSLEEAEEETNPITVVVIWPEC